MNKYDKTIHCTFDFAQTIHVPHFLMQPGSYYFKIGKTIRVFGVACESTQRQINYILPEGCYPADRHGGEGM